MPTLTVTATPTPAPQARPQPPRRPLVRCTAELAECTCPEYCDRDHDRD